MKEFKITGNAAPQQKEAAELFLARRREITDMSLLPESLRDKVRRVERDKTVDVNNALMQQIAQCVEFVEVK